MAKTPKESAQHPTRRSDRKQLHPNKVHKPNGKTPRREEDQPKNTELSHWTTSFKRWRLAQERLDKKKRTVKGLCCLLDVGTSTVRAGVGFSSFDPITGQWSRSYTQVARWQGIDGHRVPCKVGCFRDGTPAAWGHNARPGSEITVLENLKMFLDPTFKSPSDFWRLHAHKALVYLAQQVLEEVRQYGQFLECVEDVPKDCEIVSVELATPEWPTPVRLAYEAFFKVDNATVASWLEANCVAACRLPREEAALAKGKKIVVIDTGAGSIVRNI